MALKDISQINKTIKPSEANMVAQQQLQQMAAKFVTTKPTQAKPDPNASAYEKLLAMADKELFKEEQAKKMVRANYVEPMTGSERSDRANTVAAREAQKAADFASALEDLHNRFDLNSKSQVVRSTKNRTTIKELEGEREHAQSMYDTYSQLHGSYQTSPEEKKAALEQKNRFATEVQWLDTQLGAAKKNAAPSPFAPQYDKIPLYSDFDVYSKEPEVKEPTDDMSMYLKDIKAKTDKAVSGTPVLEVEREDDFNFLTDTERKTYTYLKNKYGKSMAEGYLNYMSDTVAQRRGGKIAQTLENQKGPARVVQTGGFALRSGLEQFGQGVEQAFSDEVRDVTPVQYGAQYVREDLADEGPKVLGSSLGQMAFDTTQTVGNMLPSMILSMGASALGAPVKLAQLMGAGAMGTSAGGNTYATAVREGMDPEEAREYARLVGTAAGLLQYAIGGIDKLSGGYGAKLSAKASGIENGFLRFIAKHGANALSEASEEALEAILDPVFKEIATGDDADIDWSEVVYNALLGGLTGAILGGDGEAEATQPNVAEEAGRVPRLSRVTNTEEETRTVPPLPKVGTNAESATQSVVPPLPKVGTNAASRSDTQGRVPSLPTVESVRQRANEAEGVDIAPNQRFPGLESTSINDDPAKHTSEEMNRINEYKRATDVGILNFINKVRGLTNPKYRNSVRYPFSDVTQKAAQTVRALTGVDASGFKNILTGSVVDHITRRHGAHGKADHSMANDNDIARMRYVLDNFDNATLLQNADGSPSVSDVWKNSDGTPAQRIIFTKKIDGTYYVVEATPDSNAKVLAVESVFIGNINRSTGTVLNIENDSPQVTSETPQRANAPTTNLAQPGTRVNSEAFDDEKPGIYTAFLQRDATNAQTDSSVTEGQQDAMYRMLYTEELLKRGAKEGSGIYAEAFRKAELEKARKIADKLGLRDSVPGDTEIYAGFIRQHNWHWGYEGDSLQKGDYAKISKLEKRSHGGIAKAGKAEANGRFLNRNEKLYRYAEKVSPIDGYEDFTCHSDANGFYIDSRGNGNEEDFISLSPEEYAEAIRNSSSYKGGDIRIISCQAGALENGAAQRLADAMNVNVYAPTEIVSIDENGNMFISDNDILADLWYDADENERARFKETGKWIVFKPRKGDMHDYSW